MMFRDPILRLMPAAWRKAAEAESREWHLVCGRCGTAESVWSRGGLRWKGLGRPLTNAWCHDCAAVTPHRVERRRTGGRTGRGGGGKPANTA